MKNKEVKSEDTPEELAFHYKKTDSYRTYHVDGAYGGITPKGNIYMELFVERLPTPKEVVLKIEDGKPGKEISREGKKGILRQIEAGIVLDLKTAEAVYKWLGEKVDELKQIIESGEHK